MKWSKAWQSHGRGKSDNGAACTTREPGELGSGGTTLLLLVLARESESEMGEIASESESERGCATPLFARSGLTSRASVGVRPPCGTPGLATVGHYYC